MNVFSQKISTFIVRNRSKIAISAFLFAILYITVSRTYLFRFKLFRCGATVWYDYHEISQFSPQLGDCRTINNKVSNRIKKNSIHHILETPLLANPVAIRLPTSFDHSMLSEISKFRTLRAIKIDDRLLLSELTFLGGMKNLESVVLNHIDAPTDDEFLYALSQNKRLRSINLSKGAFTDSGLSSFAGHPHLEWLVIQSDNFTNEVFTTLAQIPNLKFVHFGMSKGFDSQVVYGFVTANPDITVFYQNRRVVISKTLLD